MDIAKTYKPKEHEDKIYALWEKGGWFRPEKDKKKKPFTILLPPPNANDPLHMGHALYVVEDILCRWRRMQGIPTLYLPGTDHAGIETQYVFEKKLAEKGKSRFDFDRETLYKTINEFVEKNRGIAKEQMKRLGFGLDWSREKYTLDPDVLKIVFETFRKLHQDGLIYRGDGIVNYCTHCGTAFSELEVNHIEREDFLYWLDYGIITIATTRPETIFADTAVAVNPKDKRYKKLIGKKAVLPILNKKLPVIADELVDMKFGSGALKITPAHDPTDFEIGQKHKLETIKVIDTNGKMINLPKKSNKSKKNKKKKSANRCSTGKDNDYNLDCLFAPRSIAVVGTSRSKGSIGREILHNLVYYGFQGPVYPVNPKADFIHSMKAYPSVSAIPEPVDLAVIVVPKKFVFETVRECGEKGVRGIVVISAGFK
ncbi:MAG: class I tRNA ligase family protein, partial [Planctomycetota bacterium]